MVNLKVCKNGWLAQKYNNNNAFWVAKMGGTPWLNPQPKRVGVNSWVTHNPPAYVISAIFGTGNMQPLPSTKVCKNGKLAPKWHLHPMACAWWCSHKVRLQVSHKNYLGIKGVVKWAKG